MTPLLTRVQLRAELDAHGPLLLTDPAALSPVQVGRALSAASLLTEETVESDVRRSLRRSIHGRAPWRLAATVEGDGLLRALRVGAVAALTRDEGPIEALRDAVYADPAAFFDQVEAARLLAAQLRLDAEHPAQRYLDDVIAAPQLNAPLDLRAAYAAARPAALSFWTWARGRLQGLVRLLGAQEQQLAVARADGGEGVDDGVVVEEVGAAELSIVLRRGKLLLCWDGPDAPAAACLGEVALPASQGPGGIPAFELPRGVDGPLTLRWADGRVHSVGGLS